MDELDWNGLRLLLEVSRTGSLHRAGEALGTAASTVSRRISALESRVGTPLLERGPDGCRPTSAGRRLAAMANSLARDLDRMGVGDGSAHGETLTVTAGDGFVPIVTRTISRFVDTHPACSVEFRIADEFAQLAKGDADVALRMSRRGEAALVYRRLATVEYGFYCAAHIAARVRGRGPGEVPLVGVTAPISHAPQHQVATAAGFVDTTLRTNSFSAQLAAVQAGLGVAALPRLAADDLEEVFCELSLPDAELFAVTRSSSRSEPHIAAFIDSLRHELP